MANLVSGGPDSPCRCLGSRPATREHEEVGARHGHRRGRGDSESRGRDPNRAMQWLMAHGLDPAAHGRSQTAITTVPGRHGPSRNRPGSRSAGSAAEAGCHSGEHQAEPDQREPEHDILRGAGAGFARGPPGAGTSLRTTTLSETRTPPGAKRRRGRRAPPLIAASSALL